MISQGRGHCGEGSHEVGTLTGSAQRIGTSGVLCRRTVLAAG